MLIMRNHLANRTAEIVFTVEIIHKEFILNFNFQARIFLFFFFFFNHNHFWVKHGGKKTESERDVHSHTSTYTHTHTHTCKPLSFETLAMLFLNEGRLRDYNQNFHLSQGLIE